MLFDKWVKTSREARACDALLALHELAGDGPITVGLSLVNFESTLSKATSNFSRLILLRPPVLARETRSKREAQASWKQLFLKGLILAQNERWRRGLGMQVERIPLL